MVDKINIASNEQGLTLVELILVSFFGVIILATVYQTVFFARNGLEITQRRAVMTNEVGVPLDIIDRYLSQNTALTSIAPNKCIMTIPQDPTAQESGAYTVTFEAKSNGQLVMLRTKYNTSGTALGTDTLVISERNANIVTNQALFTYYAIDSTTGNYVTTSDPALARYAVVRIVARMGTNTPVDSSRQILFRNRYAQPELIQ